jgi:type I restriction-modification system DNA methylase subunit
MGNSFSIKETARQLGISHATVLNWEKQGYLRASKQNNVIRYPKHHVLKLKEKIENGEIQRLNQRANKKNSAKTFVPNEYAGNEEDIPLIENIIRIVARYQLKTAESIFVICLKKLVDVKIFDKLPLSELLKFYNKSSINQNLKQELNLWQLELDIESNIAAYQELFEADIRLDGDFIGSVYQSILTEGHKSKEGSYYTPNDICLQMAGDYLNQIKGQVKILDPCCGTGQFLLAAGKQIRKMGRLIKPENIWGYDIDPIAVKIARINLMILFRDFDFHPNIYTRDLIYNYSLDDKLRKHRKFDLILSNPPWGAEFQVEQLSFLKEKFPSILTMESFSYFVFIALNLLNENAFLSFILPESILNIKFHKDIRKYILQNAKILKIYNYQRVFKNVFTPVIRLDLQKKTEDNRQLCIYNNEQKFVIDSSRFRTNSNHVFDIYNTSEDAAILKKVFSLPHTNLKNQADWVLGIVSGNNKEFLSQSPKKSFQAVLKGKDIGKFSIKPPKNWIRFDRDKLQQAAPLVKYKAKEKLIYKFISNKLVFAYDNKQYLSLNSANIVIPKLPDYPMKAIMALFNSSLYQFIFRKKFFAIKVLRSHLEELPLPHLSQDQKAEFTKISDQLMLASADEDMFLSRFAELDNMVFNLFALDEEEKTRVLEEK